MHPYMGEMKQIRMMSNVSQNKDTDTAELRKFRIWAAFFAIVIYVFLVINAKA